MKKETVYIKQKVILEYDSIEYRKQAIQSLKDYPNSHSVGGGSYRFYKAVAPIQITIQVRKPVK